MKYIFCFLLVDCTNTTNDIHFKDKVKVVNGFYLGCKGIAEAQVGSIIEVNMYLNNCSAAGRQSIWAANLKVDN